MSIEKITEFSIRLKKARTQQGLSKAEVSRRVGVSAAYVGQLESMVEGKEKNPSDPTITRLCQVLRVNSVWLRTGQGDMLCKIQQEPHGSIREEQGSHSFREDELPRMAVTQVIRSATAEENELLSYYDVLCDDQKKALMGVIKAMAAGVPGKSPANEPAVKDLTRKRSA